MSLVLRFQPGDNVAIGGRTYLVEQESNSLITPDGQIINLTDKESELPQGVSVRLTQSVLLPGFTLAFTAPSDVTIIRIKGGQSQ